MRIKNLSYSGLKCFTLRSVFTATNFKLIVRQVAEQFVLVRGEV